MTILNEQIFRESLDSTPIFELSNKSNYFNKY